jgi:uncharacterized protein (DUF433 family)
MGKEALIVVDPEILVGKPVLRGTRLSVEFVIGLLGQGWSEQEVLAEYPGLTHEHIVACLDYAGKLLREERVYPLPSASD